MLEKVVSRLKKGFRRLEERLRIDGDTEMDTRRKAVTGIQGVTVLVVAVFVTAYGFSDVTNRFYFGMAGLTAVVTACTSLGTMLILKKASETLIKGTLLGLMIAACFGDLHLAQSGFTRSWPLLIVGVDVLFLLRVGGKFKVLCVVGVILWLFLIELEAIVRFGLYDVPQSIPRERRWEMSCGCADPPCAVSPLGGVAAFGMQVLVFLLDFLLTQQFAWKMYDEHDRVVAVIGMSNEIALCLSRMDLDAADAQLGAAEAFPRELHLSFSNIIANLRLFRSYLPQSLLDEAKHEQHRPSEPTLHASSLSPPPGVKSGTAAIAFTDIKDSTSLWERIPRAMKHALSLHNALIRESLAIYGGYEVKTIGDAFMVAFASASDAVNFGLKVQLDLHAAAWDKELLASDLCKHDAFGMWRGLLVRIGINCGEVDVEVNKITGRVDYLGHIVNKAARTESASAPGSVTVTPEVLEEIEVCVDNSEASGAQLLYLKVPLGSIRLKGIVEDVALTALLPLSLAGREDYVLTCRALPQSGSHPALKALQEKGARYDVHVKLSMSDRIKVAEKKICATLGRVVLTLAEDVPELAYNSALEQMLECLSNCEGRIVTLIGASASVSWNVSKLCAQHVEHSWRFVYLLHQSFEKTRSVAACVGICTGDVVKGNLGTWEQRFLTFIGECQYVCGSLGVAARDDRVLAYYASLAGQMLTKGMTEAVTALLPGTFQGTTLGKLVVYCIPADPSVLKKLGEATGYLGEEYYCFL